MGIKANATPACTTGFLNWYDLVSPTICLKSVVGLMIINRLVLNELFTRRKRLTMIKGNALFNIEIPASFFNEDKL